MANKNIEGGAIALPKKQSFANRCKKDWQLILLVLPGVLFYLLFRYGPMIGLQIAFKDYNIVRGMADSPWVGFQHFEAFFASGDFFLLLKNTVLLGIYSLFWEFPFPIMFAILLNEVKNIKLKKTVQTASYLPSFLSIVVVCSMVTDMLSPGSGIINSIIKSLGGEPIYFLTKPEWYRTIYIGSSIWQNAGYGAIIYIAALSNVDQQLYEAAKIDGCGRFRSMWYVTIPGILPTVATMFIMRSGNIMKMGADKAILLYNPVTYEVGDIFATYTYRKGILETDYSYSAAVGMFEAIVALVLVVTTNTISRKISETSLW